VGSYAVLTIKARREEELDGVPGSLHEQHTMRLVSTRNFRLSGAGAAVLVAVFGMVDRLAIESPEDAGEEYLVTTADLGEPGMRIHVA
jgi:hypothetical protein